MLESTIEYYDLNDVYKEYDEQAMKPDDNSNYFLIYVNYPVIGNKEKHIDFFSKNSVTDVWGVNITVRYLKQTFNLGPDKIENQRHKIFENVLTKIINGKPLHEINGLENINEEIEKNKPVKALHVDQDKKGFEIISDREIWNPLAQKNEGDRLYNLACHSLMNFLKASINIKRLKQCPHCKRFFIANDTKRIICYSEKCFREYKRLQKQKQREDDPVKYI